VKQLLFIVKRWIKKNFVCYWSIAFWRKKTTVEAKAWLDTHYSDSALGKLTKDDARSGRPLALPT
jgi:hypothetical protein